MCIGFVSSIYECLIMSMEPLGKLWRRALFRLVIRFRSLLLVHPAIESELRAEGSRAEDVQVKRAVYEMKSKCSDQRTKGDKDERTKGDKITITQAEKSVKSNFQYASNGGSNSVSLFTKRGCKGINQDAMLVREKFASQRDTIFCGVFDGHGADGHRVARSVRDVLPERLASIWKSQQHSARGSAFSSDDSDTESSMQIEHFSDTAGDPALITAWKESLVAAYKLMDRELLIDDRIDSVSSGTTAVCLVKQGNDLIVGNAGDSRAVLGTRTDDYSLLALQLTVDSKPNEPREAERIKRRKGRVFALQNEPSVHRVWLPHRNAPGLAMARALGDYCLKSHGVISEPEVTYRRITKRDEFVVLATDGVWDVLTNEQVVELVASEPERAVAARRVVETAVRVWKLKRGNSRVDDCAAVCLFL